MIMTWRKNLQFYRGGLLTSTLLIGVCFGCSEDFDADELFDTNADFGTSETTDSLTPVEDESDVANATSGGGGDAIAEMPDSTAGTATSDGSGGSTAGDEAQADVTATDTTEASETGGSSGSSTGSSTGSSNSDDSNSASGGTSNTSDEADAVAEVSSDTETGATDAAGGSSSSADDSAGGSANAGPQVSGGSSGSDASGTPGESTGGMGAGGAESGGDACEDLPEVCDGLDNNCNDEIDEGEACPDACHGFALSEHGYAYCDVEVSGDDAPEVCSRIGLRQVWIETAEENDGLLDAIQELLGLSGNSGAGGLGFPRGEVEQASAYIGASDADMEGIWRWGDSEMVFWNGGAKGEAPDGAYQNWATGRPNNATAQGEDCALMAFEDGSDGDQGEWNDVRCSEEWPVLCEAP